MCVCVCVCVKNSYMKFVISNLWYPIYLYGCVLKVFYTQLYDIKYSYVIQIICTHLYRFEYSYLILIISKKNVYLTHW